MALELTWLYYIILGEGGILDLPKSYLLLALESSSRDYYASMVVLGCSSRLLASLRVLCLSPRIISFPFLEFLFLVPVNLTLKSFLSLFYILGTSVCIIIL